MKKFFKHPIVTFLVGMLISRVLSSVQNVVIDNVLLMIPITSLIAIFIVSFSSKYLKGWLFYELGSTIKSKNCYTIVLRKGKPELACSFSYQYKIKIMI